MIRLAAAAAFLIASTQAQANRPQPALAPEAPTPTPTPAPCPGPAPRAQQMAPAAAPGWPRVKRFPMFDFEMPAIPEIPEIPPIPEMEDFEDLPGFSLPRLLARGPTVNAGDDEDNDDDDDNDKGDHEDVRNEKGVHVYRMTPRPLVRTPRAKVWGGDDDFDEDRATGQAKGKGSATLPVKGPINFQVRAQNGDIEVVSTDKPQVTVRVSDAPAEELTLYAFGDRVEPSFRGRRTLRRGKLHVELPRGSRLDVSTMSGDVHAERLGDVRIRTMSGDVKLASVAKSEVQSISGDVRIDDATGPVRLHLVSGKAVVATSGAAPQVEFQSASGSLEWGGMCAKDCHVSAETVSGELRLSVDPRSSFELSYTSHSGELRDEVNLAVKHAPRRKHGMASGWLEATFGKGEGVIEADAFSGNLLVRKK